MRASREPATWSRALSHLRKLEGAPVTKRKTIEQQALIRERVQGARAEQTREQEAAAAAAHAASRKLKRQFYTPAQKAHRASLSAVRRAQRRLGISKEKHHRTYLGEMAVEALWDRLLGRDPRLAPRGSQE